MDRAAGDKACRVVGSSPTIPTISTSVFHSIYFIDLSFAMS